MRCLLGIFGVFVTACGAATAAPKKPVKTNNPSGTDAAQMTEGDAIVTAESMMAEAFSFLADGTADKAATPFLAVNPKGIYGMNNPFWTPTCDSSGLNTVVTWVFDKPADAATANDLVTPGINYKFSRTVSGTYVRTWAGITACDAAKTQADIQWTDALSGVERTSADARDEKLVIVKKNESNDKIVWTRTKTTGVTGNHTAVWDAPTIVASGITTNKRITASTSKRTFVRSTEAGEGATGYSSEVSLNPNATINTEVTLQTPFVITTTRSASTYRWIQRSLVSGSLLAENVDKTTMLLTFDNVAFALEDPTNSEHDPCLPISGTMTGTTYASKENALLAKNPQSKFLYTFKEGQVARVAVDEGTPRVMADFRPLCDVAN